MTRLSENQVQCVFLSGGEIYHLLQSKFLGHTLVSLAISMWIKPVSYCTFFQSIISTNDVDGILVLVLDIQNSSFTLAR